MKKVFVALLFLSLYIFLTQCTSINSVSIDQEERIQLRNLDFDYSLSHESYPIDNEIVKLGRVLFYDGLLSKNGEVSCASCHLQEFAFADTAQFSLGFEGGLTTANTPPLVNIGFEASYFWDGRARTLHDAAVMPVFNPSEMGLTISELSNRIESSNTYKELVENAFGVDYLTSELIGEAIGQFIGSMQSLESNFDKWKAGKYELSPIEAEGALVFETNCSSCHQALTEDLYLGGHLDMADIGLPFDSIISPPIYYNFSFISFALRIPVLRNLEYTAPYMHDGRFNTLEEVIDHYSEGVTEEGRGINSIDDRVRFIAMTDESKAAVIAFLKTMKDDGINESEKFSDPFIR